MADRIRIGDVNQIPKGEGRKFKCGEVDVAVFRTQSDELFATQPNCPHAGGPLADGLVGSSNVICPLHECSFDLRTGTGTASHCPNLRVYPVALTEEGEIILEIGPAATAPAE